MLKQSSQRVCLKQEMHTDGVEVIRVRGDTCRLWIISKLCCIHLLIFMRVLVEPIRRICQNELNCLQTKSISSKIKNNKQEFVLLLKTIPHATHIKHVFFHFT